MKTRTVRITLDMGRFEVAGNIKQAQDAIGRMSSYAFDSYALVEINHDYRHLNIVAVYVRESGSRTLSQSRPFIVCAVWDSVSKTYSYHSSYNYHSSYSYHS